jgi:hypothetical protein
VKVESVNLDTKNGVKKVLQFTFEKKVDTTIRRYVHTEWAVEDYKTQEELVTKREGLKSRIKHIYEAYMEYPIDTTKQFGYGTKNWSEFL